MCVSVCVCVCMCVCMCVCVCFRAVHMYVCDGGDGDACIRVHGQNDFQM